MNFFSKALINWYQKNKRDLPWRGINDPYLIWISEIILQQTRVNQGLDYYYRFIKRFPTVDELAQAEQDEVLKYWQGLGYYSRARNLHKAAIKIASEFNGIFPEKYGEILKLPGIGVYTAAAICSFAYNQSYSVVDGNVYRVLSRFFNIDTPIDTGIGSKEFALLADNLLDTANPGLHNQAIMEFGALQCVPVSPNCIECPLTDNCRANQLDLVTILPVKLKKIKVKERFFNYLFLQYKDKTFLKKRENADIWKNLYEFPLIESNQLFNVETLMMNEDFKTLFDGIDNINIERVSNPVKHILTHRIINATFFTIRIDCKNKQIEKLIEISNNDIEKYAVSRLIELFLEKNRLINS